MTAMAGGRHLRIWILTGLLAASAAAVAIWGWVASAPLTQRVAELDKEIRALGAQAASRQREVAGLTEKLRAAGVAVREPEIPRGRDEAGALARAEAIHKLGQLQAQMQALNASIAAAQAQNTQLDAQAASAEAERARLAGATADLADRITVSNRTIQALRSQIEASNQRLAPLEAENQRLQTGEKAARTRLAALTKLSKELAGIRKRREALIESSVRHYRELGDQYRTLAMRLDSMDNRANAGWGDLSRIQAALSDADDDLRQLSALNQRVAALTKALKH